MVIGATTAFCTIVARNYLSYALALLASVGRFHSDAARYVLVVDGFDRRREPEFEECGIVVSSPSDFLPYEIAMSLAYSYDVTEFSTALKPFFLGHLLNRGHQSAIYLDPDILVFASLERELLGPLRDASIVLTPHTTDPIPLDGRVPTEVTLLLAGAYNLGFIGVRDTDETRRFLAWWSDRLERYCVNQVEQGFFVDQKWVDLVPGMFPGTRVLHHRGLNVAYWNLHARELTQTSAGSLGLKSGEPLLFFHFSGFDPTHPTSLSRHQDRIDLSKQPALAKLLLAYAAELTKRRHHERRTSSYGHGTFSNGARVDHVVRGVCRQARERGIVFPDPHDIDARPSLFDYCNATDPADGGERPRVTRYLAWLHASRPDLRAAFPDIGGPNREAFLHWVNHDGNHGIDPAFVAAAAERPRARSRGLPVVNVAGYFSTESGVGEAGRAHVAGVQAAGYDVHIIDFSIGAVGSRKGEAVGDGVDRTGSVNLVCVNADQVPYFASTAGKDVLQGRYNIGSWWWELPEFPALWHESFDAFDEIWVGSAYVQSTISRVSPIPVVRVPPIVAPPPVRDATKERFGMPRDAFVFLYLFDYLSIFERKNPLAAVAAFREAFPGRPDVRLILKSVNADHDPLSAQTVRDVCDEDDRIEIRDIYLRRDEKNAMIAAADCYVSLHRSEGFGLTIAEAMYFGTPVICTGWSGNCDFTNNTNAFVVDGPLVRLQRDYGPYAAGQLWAEPDIGQAAHAMREVVVNPLEARVRAGRARSNIRTNYSADAVGEIAKARLGHIRDLGGKA